MKGNKSEVKTMYLKKALILYKEREQRSYRYIAEKTGLSASLLQKIATTDYKISYKTAKALIDFFESEGFDLKD